MLHRRDDEHDLRRWALTALQAGVLPRVRPERTWGGRGFGKACPVCGRHIEPAEMEVEFESAAAENGDAVREFHLHLPCFAAWEAVAYLTADDLGC